MNGPGDDTSGTAGEPTATGLEDLSSLDLLNPEYVLTCIVRAMTEVLTLMCARLYGRRSARNQAVRAVTAAGREEAGAGG